MTLKTGLLWLNHTVVNAGEFSNFKHRHIQFIVIFQ